MGHFIFLVSVQYSARKWFRSSCVSDVPFLQGQQLMDLENKLRVAKEELEKAALDKVRQLRCLSKFSGPFPLSFACSLPSLGFLFYGQTDSGHVSKRKEVISPQGTPDECAIVITFRIFLCAVYRSRSSKPWRTQCISASPLFCTARQQMDTDSLLHPLTCLGTLHWSTAPESLFSSHMQR